jgi:hypothetical protein
MPSENEHAGTFSAMGTIPPTLCPVVPGRPKEVVVMNDRRTNQVAMVGFNPIPSNATETSSMGFGI